MQHVAYGMERCEMHDGFVAIVSDLVSLVAHVQASTSLIDRRIALDMAIGDHERTNIVVRDDVTPRCAKASTALSSCNANLSHAVQFLLDAGA